MRAYTLLLYHPTLLQQHLNKQITKQKEIVQQLHQSTYYTPKDRRHIYRATNHIILSSSFVCSRFVMVILTINRLWLLKPINWELSHPWPDSLMVDFEFVSILSLKLLLQIGPFDFLTLFCLDGIWLYKCKSSQNCWRPTSSVRGRYKSEAMEGNHVQDNHIHSHRNAIPIINISNLLFNKLLINFQI